MKIPENLMPKHAAAMLGISIGELAMELRISYHLVHGWQRRGSAPQHAIRWLEVEIGKVLDRKRAEIEKIKDPVDRAVAISQIPALAVQAGQQAVQAAALAGALTGGGRRKA